MDNNFKNLKYLGFGSSSICFECGGRAIKLSYSYDHPEIKGVIQPLYIHREGLPYSVIEFPYAEPCPNNYDIFKCHNVIKSQGYYVDDIHPYNFGILEESDGINMPGDVVCIDSNCVKLLWD